MIALWLAAGVLAQASEAPPPPTPSGGGFDPGRAYTRFYTKKRPLPYIEGALEAALDEVVEQAAKPVAEKATRKQTARVVEPLRKAVAIVSRASSPPSTARAIEALLGPREDKASAAWRAEVAFLAAQMLAEIRARREREDEDDLEFILMTVT